VEELHDVHLLTTKLHINRNRPNSVRRAALVEHLYAGLDRRLSLISAPAGYGKSTLISEWVEGLQGRQAKKNGESHFIAWVSLDVGDNDHVRFIDNIDR
jgi:LuxR family maltose regulon positive regulatory protein